VDTVRDTSLAGSAIPPPWTRITPSSRRSAGSAPRSARA